MSAVKQISVVLPCVIAIFATVSCNSSIPLSNYDKRKVSINTGEIIMQELIVKCGSFDNNGFMPLRHTGFGQDISPGFQLENITPQAVSIVITMDDLNIPFMKSLNHWVIWNIPRMESIPENIPYGSPVISMSNAIQGRAYGKNRYRGPKQPFFIRSIHNYLFEFYVLDCYLPLNMNASKMDVVKAMQGHIIQYGNILGKYKRT